MGAILTLFMYLLGILWIVIGALLIFAPELIKTKVIDVCVKKLSPTVKALIALVFGVILLLAASQNRHTLFVIVLGLLGIVKGVMFIVAKEKMDKITDWWLKANNNIYRISGIFTILIGSIVLIGI